MLCVMNVLGARFRPERTHLPSNFDRCCKATIVVTQGRPLNRQARRRGAGYSKPKTASRIETTGISIIEAIE